MPTSVLEQHCTIPTIPGDPGLLAHFQRHCRTHIAPDWIPIRFVVTSTDTTSYNCEFATLSAATAGAHQPAHSIFQFRQRRLTATSRFAVALVIPTGIGAELGGHAGDAGPAARLLAEVSDTLLLHPNVVNASDLNEMPPNAWVC